MTAASTAPLSTLVRTLRSKNAGIDMVTFDIFFTGPAEYDRAMASGLLTETAILDLYGLDPAAMVYHVPMPELSALKFTIRRSVPSGSPGDADIFGSQQYAPLLNLAIP